MTGVATAAAAALPVLDVAKKCRKKINIYILRLMYEPKTVLCLYQARYTEMLIFLVDFRQEKFALTGFIRKFGCGIGVPGVHQIGIEQTRTRPNF